MGKHWSLALGMAALLQVCVASFGQATQPASRPGALAPVDLSQMIREKALKQSLIGKRVVCVLRVDKVTDENKSPTPEAAAASSRPLMSLWIVGGLTPQQVLDAKNPSLADMTQVKGEVDRRLAAKRANDKTEEDRLSQTPRAPGNNTNAAFHNLVAQNRKADGPLSDLSNALAKRMDERNRFPYKVSGTTGAAKLPVIATVGAASRRIIEKVRPGDEITLTGLIESVSPATATGTFTVSLGRCECSGIVPPAPAPATPPASQPTTSAAEFTTPDALNNMVSQKLAASETMTSLQKQAALAEIEASKRALIGTHVIWVVAVSNVYDAMQGREPPPQTQETTESWNYRYGVSGTAGTAKLPVTALVSADNKKTLLSLKAGDQVALAGLIEEVTVSPAGAVCVKLGHCQCGDVIRPAASTPPTSQPMGRPTGQTASQPNDAAQQPGKVVFYGVGDRYP